MHSSVHCVCLCVLVCEKDTLHGYTDTGTPTDDLGLEFEDVLNP